MAKVSREGSLHYVFMDSRHLPELITAGRAVHDDWLNLCVWAKSNAGMGSLYRSQHELVAVFRKGKRPHINNVELGRNGRHRSNLWNHAGANSFSAERDEFNTHIRDTDTTSDRRYPIVDRERGIVMSFVMYHQYGKSPCTTVVDDGLVCPPHGGRPFTLALAEAFKISDGSIHEMEAVFTVYPDVRRRGAW